MEKWTQMKELVRLLAREHDGQPVDRRRVRDLAETLLPLHPEITVTLSSVATRMGAPTNPAE